MSWNQEFKIVVNVTRSEAEKPSISTILQKKHPNYGVQLDDII